MRNKEIETLVPERPQRARRLRGVGTVDGGFQHVLEDGRVQCDLCPRLCRLHPGQRGFCFVRMAEPASSSGESEQTATPHIVLTSYGRASGFCLDPIEKKPLNHFYPGTSVLSFGTAGCNLGCRFCQNWDISKAKDIDRLGSYAPPEQVAQAAANAGAKSIAFTYNDPVIFAEYAMDCALAAREVGLHAVVVSAGYITDEARAPFYSVMDAANIDLKAFTDRFYKKLCFAELAPVLETLRYLRHETNVWLEITTLLIPGQNDSEAEIDELVTFIGSELGADVPLHFSAFHPDWKLTDIPATPANTLARARKQALAAGLHHVYTGNVHDPAGQSTYCAACKERVIERDFYAIGEYHLTPDGSCTQCGEEIPGRFGGAKGTWGRRRLPVALT